MKTEHSAGGVVCKMVGDEWHVLLICDMNDNWTFPKGIIDPGESPGDAAEREVREETGLTGTLIAIGSLPPVQYEFKREGVVTNKTVDYFVYQYEGSSDTVPQKEEGISQVIWATFEQARSMLSYKETNESLLDQALVKLRQNR